MTAPFGRRRATVVARREVGPYVVLQTDDAEVAVPGQFFMVAAAERWGAGVDERPFLPRALSTLQANATFFLHDVGPGTHRLCEGQAGDELWLTGPLGGPFPQPAPGTRPVLVAGGVGVPPIAFLASELDRRPPAGPPRALLGFRDAHHAQAAVLVPGAEIATDDGSAGHHGLVTDLLGDLDGATLYACGPPAMLEAIRRLAVERGVTAHLALESAMACGFGACFGCVTPLAGGGYSRVCVDGPVFEAATLERVLG